MAVSADALEALLQAAAGPALRLRAAAGTAAIGTGRIETDSGPLFLKTAPMARIEAEREGLEALAQAGVRTPAIIAHGPGEDGDGDGDGDGILVLEYLDLHPIRSREAAHAAAAALAQLHGCRGEAFGWATSNFIGTTPQQNASVPGWARFFVERRLRPQFALARRHGYGGELQRNGEQLMERFPALFLENEPASSLLHGDLWSGNFGMLADGTPVFFDPAVYFGDREADLAMNELFGGLPDSFYAEYRRLLPLSSNYEQRKLAYNLYHILNHLNLFGRSYLRQAEYMAAQLARILAR